MLPPPGTPLGEDRPDPTTPPKKKKKRKKNKPPKHLPRPPGGRSRDARGSRKHKSKLQGGSEAQGYPLLRDLPDDQNHLTSGRTESGFLQGSRFRRRPRTRSNAHTRSRATGYHYQGDVQPGPTPATSHNNTNDTPLTGQQPGTTATLQWSQHTFDTNVQAAIRVGDWKLLTGDPGHGDWVPPQVLRTRLP